MKKTISSVILCILVVSANVSAQNTDFWVGKWQFLLKETPRGNVRLNTHLTRKDGKLVGEFKDATGTVPDAIPITKIEESETNIKLYFAADGHDLSLDVKKITADSLSGKLIEMFDASAIRLKDDAKNTDFYAGKWEISVIGSPRGDVKYVTNLIRKDGKLTGELVGADDDKRPISKIEENDKKLIIYFASSQGGDVALNLDKADENTLRGSIMGYEAKARRIK